MGAGTGAFLRVATLQGHQGDSTGRVVAGAEASAPTTDPGLRSDHDAGRRRFTIAAATAIGLIAVPFLWILWGPWESPNPIRKTVFEDNFYDLQARAMFHGHLWLSNGAIGIEAFVHGGRQYTYFGLFPSLIRMPIMAFTSTLDGKLTAPYMLAAWLLTGLFASLLLWRVRFLIRGRAVMGWAEATSFGVLVASFAGGTVWMLLAATPFVFNEDIAWSVCLTIGSIFALLGVLERPSRGRVVVSFVFVLAVNLDRATTGWACVVGAVLIALWFGLGRGGTENRRWCIPLLGVGLIPLLIGCAVNYSKFGVLFGVSNFEQVWTHVNAYRRKFLAANHNAEEGTIFVPTNIVAYFRPDGLRFTSVFPFITLPAGPPSALSGVLFDRRYRTASLPASMPLLFLLSMWGLVTAFRPKPIGRVALTRVLLLAAGSAGAALLLWGYIAPRYLGDFVPFLVLSSAVAMTDIWRRLAGRTRSIRLGALVTVVVVALFTIAANIGIAITPNEEWNTTQTLHYVEAQKAFSDFTGHPLNSRVVQGSSLPTWGPADQLFVVGACDGLYISNGENYSTVPSQQFQRTTWMVVELGHSFQHTFTFTLKGSSEARRSGGSESIPLVTAGKTTVAVNVVPVDRKESLVSFTADHSGASTKGNSIVVAATSTHQIVVVTDPAKHLAEVSMDGRSILASALVNGEPIHADAIDARSQPTPGALSVVNDTASSPEPTLCQNLSH